MPTRRRLHSHTQQDNSTAEVSSLIDTNEYQQQHCYLQQQQQHQQQNLLFVGTGRTTAPVPAAAAIPAPTATSLFIGDGSNNYYDNDENKYEKAGGVVSSLTAGFTSGQWNLRALSSRLQTTSGQALRTYIQQPLSAAAAVVVGNAPSTDINYNTNDNNNQQQFLSGASFDNNSVDVDSETNPDSFPDSKNECVVMAARDRTGEFTNAIRSLQSRNITRAVNIRDPRRAKQVQSYAEFMMVAKHIGRNIASTYAKLEKLTMLAKKKSLFDDRPQEIQELTYIIKGDLNALNQHIARLQDIAKEQRRSSGSGNSGKHLASHSSNMVLALQSKLASMSTDFKQILEVRTENLKQQKTRRDQFSQGPQLAVSTVSPTTAKQGSLLLSVENQTSLVHPLPQQKQSAAAVAVSIDMSSGSNIETVPLLGGGGSLRGGHQSQQQIALYDESDNYVQQRAETMQNIESTIVELGGIFQQLAHMVKEQEEIVERIDTNIQDAEINIEAAHGEILKYFQGVSKNRWLMIKIFGVLIFFFIFFVVFLT